MYGQGEEGEGGGDMGEKIKIYYVHVLIPHKEYKYYTAYMKYLSHHPKIFIIFLINCYGYHYESYFHSLI